MIPIGETAHVRRGAGATFHEDEEFPRAEQDLWFTARRDDSPGGLGGHFEARPIQ